MKYAGIGSRSTPSPILQQMYDIAHSLAQKGWMLRSGRAQGADQAFETGCDKGLGLKQIFLPWRSFESDAAFVTQIKLDCPEVFSGPSLEALEMAQELLGPKHWGYLSQGAQKLHARNCHQILGPNLNDPVACVLYAAELDLKDGFPKGGTRTAVRLALKHGIPCFNLQYPLPEMQKALDTLFAM